MFRNTDTGPQSSHIMKPKPPPSYRQRAGKALVTLTDARTGKRRDYWLGPHGSPESREQYHRVIAEWEANWRRLPPPLAPHTRENLLIVNEVMRDYWRWAEDYYTNSELASIQAALRVVRRFYGSTPAYEFGPNRLRLVRDEMVCGDPPRKPWSRRHVNSQIHRVCAMFKWAASHELLPAKVYQRLKMVPAMRRGRTTARESEPVQPVPIEHVESVKPFLSRQVRALVDLQLHTGARGGELFKLRAIDITMNDRSGIWTISLDEHKTAHHGHRRTIYLGPKAQAVLRPFLTGRSVDAFLFSPAEAERERYAEAHAKRKTPLSCGNRPGTNRKARRSGRRATVTPPTVIDGRSSGPAIAPSRPRTTSTPGRWTTVGANRIRRS